MGEAMMTHWVIWPDAPPERCRVRNSLGWSANITTESGEQINGVSWSYIYGLKHKFYGADTMTEPTEAMVDLLAKSMRDVANKSASADPWIPDARNALRAILAAPQDYGLIVPPTRSQLEQAGQFSWNAHEEDDQYLGEKQIELLIAEKWATEDPIPEPAPVPTIATIRRLVASFGKAMDESARNAYEPEYIKAVIAAADALMAAITQLAERGDEFEDGGDGSRFMKYPGYDGDA
jgi:hypothetical protein